MRERTGTRVLGAVVAIGLVATLVAFLTLVPEGRNILRGVQERVERLFAEPGKESRWHIWRAALEMYRDAPVAGVGLDCFQLAFMPRRTPEYWHVEWNGTPTKAHNELLHIAATQGTLGLLALGLLTAALGLAFRRALRRAPSPDARALVVAIGAGLVGFYAQDFFSFTVAGCGTLMVSYAAILAALAGYEAPEPEEEAAAPAAPAPAAAPGAGGSARGRPRPAGATGGAGPVALLPPLGLGAVLVLAAWLGFMVYMLAAPAGRGGPAKLLLLAAMLALALAAYRALTAPPPAGAGPPPQPADDDTATAPNLPRPWVRPDRLWRARAAQALVWPLLGVAIWFAVVIPFRANAACREGRTLNNAGRYREAIPALERAVALDPTKELYWVQLGTAYLQAGMTASAPAERRALLERALQAHARSLALVPVNAYNHANYARTLHQLALLSPPGASPEATIAAYQKALEIDPNNAYFLRDAAEAALDFGMLELAEQIAGRAVERYTLPDRGIVHFAPPHETLGDIAVRRQQWEQAAEQYELALRGNWRDFEGGQLRVLEKLARVRLQQGRKEDAARAYAQLGGEREQRARQYAEQAAALRERWLEQLAPGIQQGERYVALLARLNEQPAVQSALQSAAQWRQFAAQAYRRALELAPGLAEAQRGLERLEAAGEH
ncbi:MAG: hypothetical protein KatS3mg102_0632 [Planctomycetota bacterium]|nr:MAG: hypothetical protein KatS3mg102_0632 [Planctomycetota bacterium]